MSLPAVAGGAGQAPPGGRPLLAWWLVYWRHIAPITVHSLSIPCYTVARNVRKVSLSLSYWSAAFSFLRRRKEVVPWWQNIVQDVFRPLCLRVEVLFI